MVNFSTYASAGGTSNDVILQNVVKIMIKYSYFKLQLLFQHSENYIIVGTCYELGFEKDADIEKYLNSIVKMSQE